MCASNQMRVRTRQNTKNILSRWQEENSGIFGQVAESDIGFAIWFYDDGYYFKRDCAFYLYLGTVSAEEANIAHETIEKNFSLKNTVLNKQKKGFAIYFPASEREKIVRILSKYPVPVMGYKVPAL